MSPHTQLRAHSNSLSLAFATLPNQPRALQQLLTKSKITGHALASEDFETNVVVSSSFVSSPGIAEE